MLFRSVRTVNLILLFFLEEIVTRFKMFERQLDTEFINTVHQSVVNIQRLSDSNILRNLWFKLSQDNHQNADCLVM